MEQSSSEADKSISWSRNYTPFMEPEAVLVACFTLVPSSTYFSILKMEVI
jgi:hypothetical protein